MPIKTQNTSQALKPIRMSQPAQKFLLAIFFNNYPRDFASQHFHPLKKPARGFAAMER
jgi:hypothetical protein